MSHIFKTDEYCQFELKASQETHYITLQYSWIMSRSTYWFHCINRCISISITHLFEYISFEHRSTFNILQNHMNQIEISNSIIIFVRQEEYLRIFSFNELMEKWVRIGEKNINSIKTDKKNLVKADWRKCEENFKNRILCENMYIHQLSILKFHSSWIFFYQKWFPYFEPFIWMNSEKGTLDKKIFQVKKWD